MEKNKLQIPSQDESAERAKQIILQERSERAQACQDEINVILKKYRCQLDVTMVLKTGQVIPQLEIIPAD